MHWEIEPPSAFTKADPELGQPSGSSDDQLTPVVAFQLNESSLAVLKPGFVSRLPELLVRQTQVPPEHELPVPQFKQLAPQ